MYRTIIAGAVIATLGTTLGPAPEASQSSRPAGATAGASLGTVTLSRRAMADGRPLAPGTYVVRLGKDDLTPAPGQSPGAERYIEFLKDGTVIAREVATVIQGPDASSVLKGKGPRPGASRVDLLKGNDYLRIWLNSGGTHFLINLPTS